MKNGAIACFVLSALLTISAINTIMSGVNRPEKVENFVGYVVGAFLLPIVFLIIGLVLLDKSKKS